MNFNEGKPIYLQIADRIMDDVVAGVYPPDSRLESVRDFAGRVGVNANTVMRTYTWLQERGIIYNRRGIGYFISPQAPQEASEILRSYFFEREAPYFLNRLAKFGITPEELAAHYSEYLGNSR